MSSDRGRSTETAPQRQRLLPFAVLALGLLFGSGLIQLRNSAKAAPYHDDVISLLAATCHQASYQPQELAGSWLPASRWQAYTEPDRLGCFADISHGLVSTDIHPPLYFWVLHVWVHAFGSTLEAIAWLSVLLHVATAAGIACVCRMLGCSSIAATTASLAWLLSGSTMSVAAEIRPYSLLALLSLMFLATVLAYLRTRSSRYLALAYVTATLGFLTHYHFVLTACAVCIPAVIVLVRRRDLHRALGLILIAGLSLGTLFVLHAGAWDSITRVTDQEHPSSEIRTRVVRTTSAVMELGIPRRAAHLIAAQIAAYWYIAVALLLLVTVIGLYRHRSALANLLRTPARLPLSAAVMLIGAVAALYVSLHGPAHAMGPKYLAIAAPMLFVALGQLLASPTSARTQWLLAGIAIATQAIISLHATFERYRDDARAGLHLRPGVPIVFDTLDRGVVPGVVRLADRATPVYVVPAGKQKRGVPDISHSSVYYFSGEGDAVRRREMLDDFAKDGFRVVGASSLRFVPGELYELASPADPAN